MFHLVTLAVVAVCLCSNLVQHAISSDPSTSVKCQGETCPEGQYCKMSLGECQRKLALWGRCEDHSACWDDQQCLPYKYNNITYCQRFAEYVPTFKCHGEYCYYGGQHCNQRHGCANQTNKVWQCEGDQDCVASLKCFLKWGKFKCNKTKSTDEMTTTTAMEATTLIYAPQP